MASASSSSMRTPLRTTRAGTTTAMSKLAMMAPPSTPHVYPKTPRTASRPGTANNQLKEQDPIQVFCRVKPLWDASVERCVKIQNETEVSLLPPDNPSYWRQNQAKEGRYTFSRVYVEATRQKSVFDEVALPLVKEVIEGKNALLFAYGVTGSGKTFTMTGTANDCGIMPRCLDVMFNSIAPFKATKYVFKPDKMNGFESQSKADAMHERQKDLIERTRDAGRIGTPRTRAKNAAHGLENFASRTKEEHAIPLKTTDSFYSVFITHIEIYNNFVYDLLDETPIDMGRKVNLQSKMLREDGAHNVYVNGVTEVEVESPEDAFEVFQRGLRRRRIAHTALNTESSRSHTIFNIRLVRAPADSEGDELSDSKESIIVSQLSLVDLAGSERYSRTQATGDRLKEAGNINNSLMALRKCMDILRENQQCGGNRIVPFRDTKITHFLKNYFEGEGRVRMILCVNPRPDDYEENFHVLSFAEQAQEVQIQRPPEKRVVDLQTPGRVRANELYKSTVRQLVADKVPDADRLPKTNTTFVFQNLPIPVCHINKSNEAQVLATLRKALELRMAGTTQFHEYVNKQGQAFRQLLVDMDRENQSLKHENGRLKITVETLTDEKSKSEEVLRQMVHDKTDLEVKCEGQERQMKEMEEELEDLRQQFYHRDLEHYKDKRKLKTDLNIKHELNELQRDRQLRHEQEKIKAQFQAKEQTLEAVRQLVTGIPQSQSRRSRPRGRTTEVQITPDSISSASTNSEPDLSTVVKSPTKTMRSRAPSAPLLPVTNLSGSPYALPSRLRKAAGIPLSHRPRARSTDKDKWIEHSAGIPLKESTLMQPCMKNKKSVTQLTNVEDIPAASKYCLRTEEKDSDGEIQTRLYKADIIGTVGGGAQVVFNDVEVLHQESPTALSPRKRRSSAVGLHSSGLVSSSPFLATRVEVDHADVAERCKTGGFGNSPLVFSAKRYRPE